MKVRILALTVLLLIPAYLSVGQTAEEQRALFAEAQSHYLFGEYELANPLYLILNEFLPDNYNIRFKIGDCYLNIPDERSKAISYLEDAVKHSSAAAKPDNLRETSAPLEAWFSLATAYRMNNELDKAINTYQTYLKLATESKSEINADFVNQQITACRNAIRLMEEPIEVEKISLGPVINQGSVNFSAVISFDGNSMVFAENRGLENAIFYTIKERGVWQPPVEISIQLGDARDCHPTSLNADGTELYLYKNDNYDGNIYVSNLSGGNWSKIRSLNRNINTRYYESHAAVSANGKKLYFTSNRPGGYGELDIYVAEKTTGDEWGVPVNLGATINTPFNEDTPFITANDSLLVFASEGHSSMGGYDIYRSVNLGQAWKSPENLGYPINSTDDDLFFQPFDNASRGYYSLYTGYKNREIFTINLGAVSGAEEFEIRGFFSLADTTVRFNENYSIYLINLIKGDTLDIAFPNEFTGLYTFINKAGTYRITYTGLGYLSQTTDTTILPSHPSTSVRIDVSLQPDPDYRPEEVIKEPEPVYEKIDLAAIPTISQIDSSILVTNIVEKDVGDAGDDAMILYYTVQVMALHKPVDVTYFTHITDMVVLYNDIDKFYRYTTGRFKTREEAYSYRLQLIAKGYPNEIFIKKVFRE